MKQPRYLIGTVLVLLYFGFLFLRSSLRHLWERPQPYEEQVLMALGSFVIFCLLLLAWAWPGSTAGLGFSEAEIQFLFPAPLTRRQLLLYRVTRAQVAILSTAFIFWLFAARGARFAGLWASFIVLDLYFLMVKLGRARLKQLRVGFLPRAVIVALILIGFFAAFESQIDRSAISPGPRGEGLVRQLVQPLSAPWMKTVLFVPSLLVRPLIAPGIGPLLLSMAPLAIAGVVFFMLARWLDVSFEDASIAGARRTAERLEQMRMTRHGGASVVNKRTPQPFHLGATGPPEVAIVWKNLISAARFSLAPLILTVLAILVVTSSLSYIMRWDIALMTAMIVCAVLGGVTVVMGPFFVRADLRMDCEKLDVLKSYPLEGKRLVGGEIAGCFVSVFLMQLFYLSAVLIFSLPILGYANWAKMAAWVPAGLLIGSAVTLIQITVQNAVLLLFPAWMAPSKTPRGGMERAGTNLLLLFVNLLFLTITAIPAGLVFGLSFWAVWMLSGLQDPAIAFLASIPTVMMLLAEFWIGLELLGTRFEELDIAEEFIAGTA